MRPYMTVDELTRSVAKEEKERNGTTAILALLAATAVVGLALAYFYLKA